MEIILTPFIKTNKSTTSELTITGNPFKCFVLEDVDRGLKQSETVESIKLRKIFAETAIPAGRYEVVINFSNRFQKFLPQLLNVPGFEGIRIHPGNKAEDTEGCLLVGLAQSDNWVSQSVLAFKKLMAIIEPAAKKEKIFITITR